jgi:hypothetical protein
MPQFGNLALYLCSAIRKKYAYENNFEGKKCSADDADSVD